MDYYVLRVNGLARETGIVKKKKDEPDAGREFRASLLVYPTDY